MPLPSTMIPIATNTLASSSTSVTFSNIPNSYTDLILVMYAQRVSGNPSAEMLFNSDTGANYSFTNLLGNGTTATGYRGTASSIINLSYFTTSGSPNYSPFFTHIMSYSNTTTYKTIISKAGDAGSGIQITSGLWLSTSAINSITLRLASGTVGYGVGSVFTIYGIKAA